MIRGGASVGTDRSLSVNGGKGGRTGAVIAGALALAVLLGGCSSLSPDAPPGGGGGLPDPSTLRLWRHPAAASFTRPLVSGSTVFFSTADTHDVTALDKASGALLWKTHLTLSSSAGLGGLGLVMAGGRLVVGDGDVFGLDPATGTIVWHYVPTSGRQPGFVRLTSDGTTAYCGSGWGGYVYAVDGASGAERWATQITPDSIVGVYSPVLDHGVVFAGYSDLQVHPGPNQDGRSFGGIAAIDASSGRVLWIRLLPHPDSTVASTTQGVLASGGRVFAYSFGGGVYVLDEATGETLSVIPSMQFAVTSLAGPAGGDRLFAVSGSILFVGSIPWGTITAMSLTDFHRLWIVDMHSHGSVNDLVADSAFVYTNYVGGQFSVTRVSDGSLVWMIDAAALRSGFNKIAAGPAIDGDRLYLGGFNEAYAMRRQ
jgi:outer membrane protein assembly factor BamB